MRLIIIALVLVIASAASAAAQVTAETLTIYRQGSSTPAGSYVLPRANRTCAVDITPAPPGTVVNPRIVEWNDPDRPSFACVWVDPGTGPLAMLAQDNLVYDATIKLRVGSTDGPEGPRGNPFTRPMSTVTPRIRP